MSDFANLQALQRSNLPHEQKSAFRRWYESITGAAVVNGMGQVNRHVAVGAHALRAEGEALVTGALLGLADSHFGGLDVKGYPIDGIASLIALAGQFAMANHADGLATDLRNVGTVCTGVFAYRKSKEYVSGQKGSSTVHGDYDPIVACANNL